MNVTHRRPGGRERIRRKPSGKGKDTQARVLLPWYPRPSSRSSEEEGGLDDAKWFRLPDILDLNFYDDMLPIVTAAVQKLARQFMNIDLLAEALTHRSYLNEHRAVKQSHNERLEFLGDAVLELAVTHFLFNKFPDRPEGDLTNYRAALVNTVSLAETAQAIGLGELLLLSKGEARDTGRARENILANAFEAVIGALYLDQGYAAADAFIGRHLYGKIDPILAERTWQDAKSRFQEASQQQKSITPTYKTISEIGPDHAKEFTVAVLLGSQEIARGAGNSKQDAEQSAAKAAIETTGW
jgi:ribonuclease-3